MRIRELQSYMRIKDIELTLLFNFQSLKPSPNYLYLSGFHGAGVFAIKRTGKPILLVPEPEYPIAKKELPGLKIINFGNSMLETLKKRFVFDGRAAFDYGALSLSQYNALKKHLKIKKVHDISGKIFEIRSKKDPKEISYLKKSCSIAEGIINKAIKVIRRFKTESELYTYLVSETNSLGLRVSFDPIVASGKNSGKWHHITSKKKISNGFLMLDFGVKYNGYCSDITRTIYIGKPTPKELEDYKMVQSVQKKCIEMLKPGSSFIDAHKYASNILGKSFVHSLGHGIGLEEHENPFVRLDGKETLKPGMTMAVEPGVYYPYKYGIRIEDDILITEKGNKILTSGNNDLIIRKGYWNL